MKLAVKQITTELFHNKIFIFLLLLLMGLTSLSFFFVRFSIDGNMAVLNSLNNLNKNQQLYKNALDSNTSLAYLFFLASAGLTVFVILMFFYRFFRTNRVMIGCLKSLGFQNDSLQWVFTLFIAALSMLGALAGMIGGYYLSTVLIEANRQTYSVSGLVKDVNPLSVFVGLGLSTLVFSATAFFTYFFISGKETGTLLAGNYQAAYSGTPYISDKTSKLALSVSLRKPVAILLILIAVMSFSIFVILGCSLNISNQKVFDSQTIGHNYECDVHYPTVCFNASNVQKALPYMEAAGTVAFGSHRVEQNVTALYTQSPVLELQNSSGDPVVLPKSGEAVIGPGLVETYGLHVGDTVTVKIGSTDVRLRVRAAAANAKSGTIYINTEQMTQMMRLPAGSYTGELYSTAPDCLPEEAEVITRAQRIENLNRSATSNKTSAVINQVTGILVGCILLFLALYVNFQDNTRDILILHIIGYQMKQIRKMLIDIYLPILWFTFIITLLPSIFTARAIQRSLSITTKDYMPFGTSPSVILLSFAVITIIYRCVLTSFSFGIRRIIQKENRTQSIITE
ncbi:MAG: FtsX-like permease family protein [Lachnospiraceae bacterium]